MTIILGIDPGLQHTGWGIIKMQDNALFFVACGAVHSKPKDELSKRLFSISDGLKEVIATYQPDQCAIEETFLNKNPMSSLKLGHARGAVMLTVSLAGLSISEYAATLVKKTVVGVGRAEKAQVMMMVKQLLPKADITSEDAADALAVAICHTQHSALKKMLEKV